MVDITMIYIYIISVDVPQKDGSKRLSLQSLWQLADQFLAPAEGELLADGALFPTPPTMPCNIL